SHGVTWDTPPWDEQTGDPVPLADAQTIQPIVANALRHASGPHTRSARVQHGVAAVTAYPVDAGLMESTIRRALAGRAGPLPYQELVELEQLLRGHMQLLLPSVQEGTDYLSQAPDEWHRRVRAIDEARQRLAQGLGNGLLSASVHVNALA